MAAQVQQKHAKNPSRKRVRAAPLDAPWGSNPYPSLQPRDRFSFGVSAEPEFNPDQRDERPQETAVESADVLPPRCH